MTYISLVYVFAVEQRILGPGKVPFSAPTGSAFSRWWELAPWYPFKPSDSRTGGTSALLVSDVPHSPQGKRTGWLRHQALSDALDGMRHRVETTASVWTVGLTSIVSAGFVTTNGILASPWPAGVHFKSLGLNFLWIVRDSNTGRKGFTKSHVWMPVDFPSRIVWQIMPTKCQNHSLKTIVLFPFPKTIYKMSSSSPSSKLSAALPLWQLRQVSPSADTTASACVSVWCPWTAPQDLLGSEKRVLLMQPEFICASRFSDFWLCPSQPVQ